MAKKPNPLLAAIEAKWESICKQQIDMNSELDYIAFMLTINEELNVGPGRADRLFNAFLANKLELAETINADYGETKNSGDKELLQIKKHIAGRLKAIFGQHWPKWREMFPFVRIYWDE